MDRFRISEANWQPYWSDDPVASADSDAVKVSAWTRNDEALLFISHLDRRPATVRVDSPRFLLHKHKVTDALTATALDLKDGALEISFGGMGYRLIEIAPE